MHSWLLSGLTSDGTLSFISKVQKLKSIRLSRRESSNQKTRKLLITNLCAFGTAASTEVNYRRPLSPERLTKFLIKSNRSQHNSLFILSRFAADNDATRVCVFVFVFKFRFHFGHFWNRPQSRQRERDIQSLQRLSNQAEISLRRENLQPREPKNAFGLFVQRKHRASIVDRHRRPLCLRFQRVWRIHRECHKWRESRGANRKSFHSPQLHHRTRTVSWYRAAETQTILGDAEQQ